MIATPDWGPLEQSRHETPEVDHYGKHDLFAVEGNVCDAELDMHQRAEQVKRYRHNFGWHYFPAQHSLNVGAGVKLTVAEIVAKVSS